MENITFMLIICHVFLILKTRTFIATSFQMRNLRQSGKVL